MVRRHLLLCVLLAACDAGTQFFTCNESSVCMFEGTAGVCEPDGFCSFPDPGCPQGRRYGEFSGPASNQCVGGSPDAGNCPNPLPDDDDCDDVPNGADNCRTVANTNQDNEDGDVFGDACDPCPPIADDNPPDGDDDGVGDACDPNPGTPGDVIFVFEGFNRDVSAAWDVAGPVNVNNGEATASPGNNQTAHLAIVGPLTGRETVSTSVTIEGAAQAPSAAGVIDENEIGGDSGIGCQLDDDGAATLQLVINGGATIDEAAYQLAQGETYLLALRRHGTSYTCRGENGAAIQNVAGSDALTHTPGQVGLRAFSAVVRFQWMMTISSP